MGGQQRVVTKLAAFSHAECDTPENRDAKNLEKKIQALKRVEIDNSYPRAIVEHLEEWRKKGFIDTIGF